MTVAAGENVLVVVLDQHPDPDAVRTAVAVPDRIRVRFVAPAHVGPLHWATTDEDEDRAQAEAQARAETRPSPGPSVQAQLAPFVGARQRGGARGRRRRPRAGAADQVPRSGGDARGLDDHAPYPSRGQLAHSRTSVTSTARTGPSGGSLRYCGYFSVSSTSARSRSSLWSSTRARPRRRTHQRRPQFSS